MNHATAGQAKSGEVAMSAIQPALVHALNSPVTTPGFAHKAATADTGFICAISWFAIVVSAVALSAKITPNVLKRSDHGIVRSALALILVASLALLAAVAHFDDKNSQRQTLPLGAVAAPVSAVVAFLSSRSAKSARKNLLSAMNIGPQVPVPDFAGTTVAVAKSQMSALSNSLTLPLGFRNRCRERDHNRHRELHNNLGKRLTESLGRLGSTAERRRSP
ncbi:hypothetical protein [Streptomyces rhizosphaerihabitans]|uniref:hypothetical protein n=1 Tax=Streptomyces rhizosphaerihabitans TaxID=1266770 RepID=UPI0021BF9308|nr:hypothetical protein [Streptomyces rhizosphaerihabitans]MCT9007094.1 hypothetical protein [Streptomyces rhizosphaerihabitans]